MLKKNDTYMHAINFFEILYKKINNKSIKDTKSKYSKVFKLNC